MYTYLKLALIVATLCVGIDLKAATININQGETITINANQTATVSCGNGGSSCSDQSASLKSELDACSNGNNSPGAAWCVENVWNPWRDNNPTCASDGQSVCALSCINASTSPGTAWCVENCH